MTDLVTEPAEPAGPAAGPGKPDDLEAVLERHRRELTGYCYRMLGGAHEAEDAVQETMLRAWRAYDRFEGRAAVRSWLYRIATNVCIEMLRGRGRRALPMDLAAPALPGARPGVARTDAAWLQPMPDARVLTAGDDPAEEAVGRESVRLAFVAALQHLSPRQRAVLILRDVLRWKASEVAHLLDTTVVSVNSVLRRARAALVVADPGPATVLDDSAGPDTRAFLERYVDAFERLDVEQLVALLHDDVTLAMPPHDLWFQGVDGVLGWVATAEELCRRARFVPVGTANGAPTFGLYKVGADGYDLFGIHSVEVVGGRARAVQVHLGQALGPLFDLPARLSPAELGDRAAIRRS